MTRHLPEQARREQILKAARLCFIENGYHPTRMDDIARAADLSKGGVYFHFKSKADVFASLVEAEYAKSIGFLRRVMEAKTSIAEKMQFIGRHYLEYFEAAPEAPRFFIVMGEMALRDEALAARLLEMQRSFIDTVHQLLDEGARAGIVRDRVDTLVVAAMLKALLDGLEGLKALEYPMDVSQFLTTGIELVMRGMASTEGPGQD
ncbi:MAG: TetR/AcrR family transcriptional regulator [Myxococcota bacterium]